MKFTSPSRLPAPKRSLSALAVTLLVCSVAGLLAQSAPYDPVLERRLWKELLPWGENTGPNGEVIWADPQDLNNIPSSAPAITWINDSGDPVLRSVTPHGNSVVSALAAAQTEFGLLGAIGECTFSHPGDYDLDDSIYWPQVRLCKGPQVPGGPVNTFAQLPPGPGRLLNPVGIAVSGAKVFVGDSFNHRVQVFDFYGNNIPMKYPIGNGIPGAGFYDYDVQYPGLNYRPYPGLTDGGFSGHQLSAPQGVGVDAREIAGEPSPHLLVADTNNNRIALFNDDGSAAFGTDPAPLHFYPPIPTDGANGPPQGTDPFRPNQLAISPGAVIRAPGTPIGSNDPDFGKRIAVIDWYHCYVAITDVGFNVIKTLPAEMPGDVQHDSCHRPEAGPTQPGQFSTVTGVEIDAAGNIYVSDHAQQQIQVFDRDGDYVTSIGKPGGTNPGGAGDLAGPVGLFIDDQFGRLGVIDADNARAVFYDIADGPEAVAFQFQIDTTVAVDDFPMGVAMQFGEEADGLDPKGRIMVTDPLQRRVLRWELPELVIANAVATITNSQVDPKTGTGSFDVVVPYQKLSPVNDVIVTVVPQDTVNVTIVPGTILPSLASRPDIAFGQLVHYTFQFTSTVSEAKFDITARGDCDAEGLNCLATAPDAEAIARALCDDCAASHEVFYDFPDDPDNPEPAMLVDTTDQQRDGRDITGWYDQPVFVRIRPVVPDGIADDDPNRVTQIAWWYGGAGGLQYGTSVTEAPTPGSDDAIDVSVRISGVSWLTYQAVTASGSASAPVEVLLPVDLDAPTMEFFAPSVGVPAWTPPTGNDGTVDWHNVPVTGHYRPVDPYSGPLPAPNNGAIEFTVEGRNQSVPITLEDEAGNSEPASSLDTGRGGKAIFIDLTAPDFVNGLGAPINDSSDGLVFQVPYSGVDGNGLYVNLPAGALTIAANDPLLSTGEPGSRPVQFAAGNLAASGLRNGDLITFRATDYAGNFRERTAIIEISQASATVQYIGDEWVTYGGTLTLKAEVAPTSATGTVTFTLDGRTVVGTIVDEAGPGGVRRVATAPLPSVLSNVGTYTVSLTYSGDQVLAAASNTYAIRVLKFPVHVTALPNEKISGDPDPVLEYTSVPAVEDLFLETDAFVGHIGRVAPDGNTVGVYEIQKYALTLNNPNYDLLFQPAAFKVLGVVPVTAVPQRINYGTSPAAFTFTYGTFPAGTALANVVTPPSCNVAGPHTAAGTYAIECDGALGRVLDGNGQEIVDQYGNPLLTFRYEPAELIIDKVTPVASVLGGVFTYNGLPRAATACTVAGVNGELLTGTLSYAPGPAAPVNVGDYTATCAFDGNGNYEPASAEASIRINKATPVVTVGGGPFTYDGQAHSATCTVAGVNGQALAGDLSYPAGSAPVNAGTAAANCSFAGNDNYNPASGSGTLLINPRPITVTADAKSKLVGAADPALTYSITAGSLVAGDLLTGALTRTAGELVGVLYPILQGSLTAGPNYALTYVPANLTVLPLNLPPLALDDTASSVGAAPVTITVLANDRDQDGGTLSVTGVTQPTGGEGLVTTSGNLVVFSPTPGFVGTVVFSYTISDGQGGTATASVTVTITAPSTCTSSGFLTYSQGGWGNNGAPGQFMAAHFAQVYPSGVTIGGGHTLKFTSASAVTAFLPAGGSPRALTWSAVNPTRSSAGVFAGQLLALRLAVDYSAAGKSKAGLGELVMLSGPFAGSTVNQILAVANAVIGGQSSALPSGMSISTLSGILESLNMNYHEGTVNNGLLGCPGQCIAGTITLNGGSSATSGTAGNIRTFSGAGVSVKASAFSRTKSNGAWAPAFLGAFGTAGLGVTDGGEGDGSSDKHKLDNVGDRLNYILFEFSKPVVVTRAFLTYIGADGDATVWVGNTTDPYNNHLTLSDALLASLGTPQASASSSTADRWASFNGTSVSGNVLVIAADIADSTPEDAFKIAKLDVTCATTSSQPPTVTASNQTDDEGDAVSVQIAANHPDNDELTYVVTGLPPGLSIDAATGLITGTLGSSSAGSYNVTVTVEDESGHTATASFVWTVVGSNRAPDAVNDTLATTKNTAKTISVIANDSDPDGDELTVTSITQPSMGSVVKYSNGTVKYTPPSNWQGTTSFTYTVSDDNGGTDTATVSVTVRSHSNNDDCGNDHDHDGDHDDDDDRERDCDRDHRHDRDCDRDGDGHDHDRDCDERHSRYSRCNDNDGWYSNRDRDRDDRNDRDDRDDDDHDGHNRNGVCGSSSHWRR